MQNSYCMFKGRLDAAAPFKPDYIGSPHYIITAIGGDVEGFNIVVNAASTAPTAEGDDRVYCYFDPHFDDPICAKLDGLDPGIHTAGFPRLDYWQDRSLLDIRRMRPVPYAAGAGSRDDVNDEINDLLTIDMSTPPEERPFDNGRETQNRTFWRPSGPGEVTVYGFGFLFPARDGLHETHMNQGNPPRGGHARENGVFQDGALVVQTSGGFAAMFTAFQTQFLPTDSHGFPTPDAVSLPAFIARA